MPALICGTLSFDTVMVLNDKFKHHIQSMEERRDMLDIYFVIPDLRRQFGGCAGNIAYNLKLLGEEPYPMATVGNDFSSYEKWFEEHNIKQDYVTVFDHSLTAQIFVTVDMEDNQITAFHPGAMSFSHLTQLPLDSNCTLGTVSADSHDGMMTHALQFSETGLPFIFNPGHSIIQFDGDELLKFIEQANWILVNQHEWDYMHGLTNLTEEQVAQRVAALIITLGDEGAMIYAQGTRYQIPVARVRAVNDTNNCGDAFCAGILYGLLKDADWETTGRIASLMGAIKVEHHGSQNHHFNLEQFKNRFQKTFGYRLII